MTLVTEERQLSRVVKRDREIMSPWATTSAAEHRIAKEFVQKITSTSNREKQAQELLQIVSDLIKGQTIDLNSAKLVLHKAYAVEKDEVSSNLFSQIAYEVEARDADIKESGSYFTPQILAVDMIKVAAETWLSNNPARNGITNAVWYDPCVGGGIFPAVIAEYLLGKNVSATNVLKHIMGADINPLFVQATKIRLALILAKGSPTKFFELYALADNRVICTNSLLTYPEENGIFSVNTPRVDIVVGNPPYIRSNSIPWGTKEMLRSSYPSVWTGTTDLYMFFIAHGLNALNTDGVLCYVSPATFQRTSSGQLVRRYITRYANIDTVYDFDELPVFENVGSHISVYVLSKTSDRFTETRYALLTDLPGESPLLISDSQISHIDLPRTSGGAWNFHPDNLSILSFLETGTVPLRTYTTIYSGIKTGLKKAYELNAADHAEILQDERSQKYVFPLLKPRQIERWALRWSNTYQIVIPRGRELDNESSAYQHLLKFKDELAKRTDLRKGDAWYSLRDCAYLDLFKAPKIVYRDISATPRFAIDTQGMMVVDGAFFIPIEDYFLLGLLNSKVGSFYFKSRCATIGSVGSRARLRFKKVYVSEFPVPQDVTPATKEAIKTLTRRIVSSDTINVSILEEELDNLVLDLYGVPQQYKEVILEEL